MNNFKEYVQGKLCWAGGKNTSKTRVGRTQIVLAIGKLILSGTWGIEEWQVEKRKAVDKIKHVSSSVLVAT